MRSLFLERMTLSWANVTADRMLQMAPTSFSAAALLGKGRVLARLGMVGVMDSHFEHPECGCECNEEKRWV